MSFDSTKPTTCPHYAVNTFNECYERNLDLPTYKRFFLRENCGALTKGVFETCEKVAERTGAFTKLYVAPPLEK